MSRAPAAKARPTAAFFDLDKTIIARSSTFAFSKEFQAGGLISRGTVLRSAYTQFLYVIGGADHDQMEKMRQFMSQLCTGWDVATVREIIADTLQNIIEPMVYAEAVRLIAEHHEAGRDVIIVSTSGAEMVEPIGEMLGADHVIATRLEVDEGKYTGKIRFYAYAENKAKAITDLARKRGYDLERSYAYSDSATDVPMLEAVGHAYAVNPDKELRKAARERGWPVLIFEKPVALRRDVTMPPAKPTLTAVGLSAALAVIGAAWWRTHRRSAA
jgi:HAD superfamily hydrolase (TIGR01490 family)